MPFAGIFWIIVGLLIVGVLVWGLDQLPAIDPTFKQIAKVILIVAVVIWAILIIASLFGLGVPHWR